jgi:simple sugar transport system permease protein
MAAILTQMIGPESSGHLVSGVIVLAFAAGLLTSLVIGLLTGMIVAFLGVHPILVTLGTMTAVKGILGLCNQRRGHRRVSGGHPGLG